MGKSSAKRAAYDQAAKNKEQQKKNQRTEWENQQRVAYQNKLNEYTRRKSDWLNNKQKWLAERTQKANEARNRIYNRRIDILKQGNQLLTDFELQEKRRWLKAKKGAGQVTADDTYITGADRERVQNLLKLPEDFWQNRAQLEYDRAFKNYGDYTTPEPVKPSEMNTTWPGDTTDNTNTNTNNTGNTDNVRQDYINGRNYQGGLWDYDNAVGPAPQLRPRTRPSTISKGNPNITRNPRPEITTGNSAAGVYQAKPNIPSNTRQSPNLIKDAADVIKATSTGVKNIVKNKKPGKTTKKPSIVEQAKQRPNSRPPNVQEDIFRPIYPTKL